MARWRLAAQLQRQDWAAVAIDLLIVIIGVFLGIQASNWNDTRKDRQLAGEYLGRIAGDLRYDIDQLRQREEFWRASSEAGDRALHFAEDGRVDGNDWNTLLDFYEAGQIWNYEINDGTYREMLSAGRLDLLRDNRLKADLSDYYVGQRTQAHDLFDTLPRYREDIRGAIPYRFQRYILDHCSGDVTNGYRGHRCPPPSDMTGLSALDDALAADGTLMRELRSWMTTLRYTRGVGQDNQRLAKRLIAQIAADQR
ncbi:MAG TPA: hypothetical protein VLM36_03620 [Sphingomicrobium sp.]|nr:hypothetical protein [Sphingomicrobium sp.]